MPTKKYVGWFDVYFELYNSRRLVSRIFKCRNISEAVKRAKLIEDLNEGVTFVRMDEPDAAQSKGDTPTNNQ